MSNIVNKYALYSMGKKGKEVTQKIDNILDEVVSDIKKSIITASDLVKGIDARKLGLGYTATDEIIALAFKDRLENITDNYSLSRYFYRILHFDE